MIRMGASKMVSLLHWTNKGKFGYERQEAAKAGEDSGAKGGKLGEDQQAPESFNRRQQRRAGAGAGRGVVTISGTMLDEF